MTPEKERSPTSRRKLECVERQEELTWMRFYPQARSDAVLAGELLSELERDESLRRRHRGLYLSCQRCLRTHQRRQLRNQRVGRVVRHTLSAVCIALPQAVWRGIRQVGQLLLACLPGEEADPAERQVRRLLESEAFAQADQSFRTRARKAADKHDATASGESDSQAIPAPKETAAG